MRFAMLGKMTANHPNTTQSRLSESLDAPGPRVRNAPLPLTFLGLTDLLLPVLLLVGPGVGRPVA